MKVVGQEKEFLEKLKHPLVAQILEYRKISSSCRHTQVRCLEMLTMGLFIPCLISMEQILEGFQVKSRICRIFQETQDLERCSEHGPGHKLVSSDYSQQEVFILASLADDKTMKEAYARDMDFYAYMASLVYELPYEECAKGGKHSAYRDQMKSIVLGINYDMGIASLARDIGKTLDETKAIYARFFEMCSGVKAFRQERLDFAIKNGYVETILGRKRRLSAIHLPDLK